MSRIFVAPSAVGKTQSIYEERAPKGAHVGLGLFDWTASGRHLIIVSARTGKAALHLLPVRDGRSDGEPLFVCNGVFLWGHTTKSGASFIKGTALRGRCSFQRWMPTAVQERGEEWKA